MATNAPHNTSRFLRSPLEKPACLLGLTLIALSVCWPAPPQAPAINLALNCSYVCNVETLPGWHGLVDGDKISDSAPGCFATVNTPVLPKIILLDLGNFCLISKVVVYNSANGNTRTISVSSSLDGVHYKKLRDPDFVFARGVAQTLSISFQPRSARYIRFAFPDTWKGGLGGDYCLFIREIEIFGQRTAPLKSDDPFLLAAQQAPSVSSPAIPIFKRYCLQAIREIKIAVLGDSLIAGYDQEEHWTRLIGQKLSALYPQAQFVVIGVGGPDSPVSAALQWAQNHRGPLAPDLIIVAYGTDMARQGSPQENFLQEYQALLEELTSNTAALIVLLTPLPNVDKAAEVPLAWAELVEKMARIKSLPLLRTAAILSKIADEKARLTAAGQLTPQGHKALAEALIALLH